MRGRPASAARSARSSFDAVLRRGATRAAPVALAELHRTLRLGEPVVLAFDGWGRGAAAAGEVRTLLTGAGFESIEIEEGRAGRLIAGARRARTLPDTVAPGLRLLVCGLNPSIYAADRGVPFARPGNRFWPAALEAGLVTRDRDPFDALRRGVGFTDLVKRATTGASELRRSEYAAGVDRVEALVRQWRPRAVCFVGLDGWRRTVDRKAKPGWVPGGLGGRPAYLMPSTSGLNAHATLPDFVRHLRRAAAGPRSR